MKNEPSKSRGTIPFINSLRVPTEMSNLSSPALKRKFSPEPKRKFSLKPAPVKSVPAPRRISDIKIDEVLKEIPNFEKRPSVGNLDESSLYLRRTQRQTLRFEVPHSDNEGETKIIEGGRNTAKGKIMSRNIF
jgi:hypothetical protein